MRGREFQDVAETLAKGASAAELRSAVGRAYYAAFNTSAEFVRDLGFRVPESSEAHDRVRRLLNNSGETTLVVVAQQLGTLRTKRNHADYRLTRRDVEQAPTVRPLVAQARSLIDSLEEFTDKEARERSKAVISDYLRTTGQEG
jgi:hypothetical protein